MSTVSLLSWALLALVLAGALGFTKEIHLLEASGIRPAKLFGRLRGCMGVRPGETNQFQKETVLEAEDEVPMQVPTLKQGEGEQVPALKQGEEEQVPVLKQGEECAAESEAAYY